MKNPIMLSIGFLIGAIPAFIIANILSLLVLLIMGALYSQPNCCTLSWLFTIILDPTTSIILCTIVGGLLGARYIRKRL